LKNAYRASSAYNVLKKIEIIQINIGDFINTIIDLKCVPLRDLVKQNFKSIVDKISLNSNSY